jgi:hypothetical protein
MPDDVRLFTGEPDADLERWLGEHFESWMPSKRQLVLREQGGVEAIVLAGQWVVKHEDGSVSIRV